MRTKNGFSCAFLMLWAVLRGHIGTNRGISAQMAGRYSRKEKSGKIGCTAVVQEGNIRKTMAARGLVNGRDPRSGRDLVFRCYPPKLLPPQKKQKLTFLGSASLYVERRLVFLLLFEVCLQELLLNITWNWLVVSEVHCECCAT